MKYLAVYRSVDQQPNAEGHDYVCTALFGDVNDAVKEAHALLVEGYHVMVDHGEMTDEEWEALEEVPDNFVTTSPDAHLGAVLEASFHGGER